jgi:hypothetical protein
MQLFSVANAQNIVWKRRVAREIEVGKVSEKVRAKDSALVDMLLVAIRAGKLPVYSGINNDFSRQLTMEDINTTFNEADTVVIVDPVTGKETIKIVKHDIEVYKYRVLEEWSFDRVGGTTAINIIGIAPLVKVYGSDFEAVKVLFWVKYTDIATIVVREKNIHSQTAFIATLLKDHFGPDTKNPAIANKRIGKNLRYIMLDPVDSIRRHLKDMGSDSSLYDLIVYATETKKVPIYDSSGKKLSHMDILPPPDTTTLIDPVTNNEVIKIIKHELYGFKPKYKFVEEWSFDELKGNIQIKIEKAGLFLEHPDYQMYNNLQETEDLFWVKFEDFSAILSKYEHSHYNTSLSHLLWKEYFMKEEVKPKRK